MEKNLFKLEYNKIIEILSKYCITYIGKDLCGTLVPSNKSGTVQYNLNQTTEAVRLLTKYGNPPIGEIPNICVCIKSLESYITLNLKSLLDVGHILKTARELKCYFDADELNYEDFPILASCFNNLYSNISIEKSIFDSIIDENNVADDASKALSSLRRNRKKLEGEIKDKLNSFIHSSTYSKFIMEPIITIRNDRYVIPVKVEYKDNIKGFVHDISFSGSTVYIEPIAIFDINNKINNIKAEENIEIEKIMENLTKCLYPIIDSIKNNIEYIGNIDFCFAKAKYSKFINGTSPIINSEKRIDLIGARHPLIPLDKVVANNISLGKNFSSLIITGPNTGGKTVTLKTVGLICAMAFSGLHIPVKEDSSIFVFDKIFADIGDEQSIAESLSTFSSHMLNIIEILSTATSDSLVLLDELGSGTDPLQGASLAISILEYFNKMGCLTISTTHYSEIKNYALTTNGFENASSEFDIENLQPTYKLIIGVPGKSNAFAISKRLGLPDCILTRAEDFLTPDSINIEELLKKIYDDKLLVEKEKCEIEKNLHQIEFLRKSLEHDVSAVNNKEKELIENAKIKAKQILLDAKQETDDIIRDLNKMYDESNIKENLKSANNIRNSINTKLKDLAPSIDSSANSNNYLSAEDINIGMTVLVPSFNATGVVLTRPNKSNEVQIQLGSAKMNININNLCASPIIKKTVTSTAHTNNIKSKTVSTEINVIGQTVDEATFVIDKYLDDCAMANLPSARIVHGKGTGKLRAGIHTFLKTHPHVKSFRLGTFGEGEMGVTVVEIK